MTTAQGSSALGIVVPDKKTTHEEFLKFSFLKCSCQFDIVMELT